MHPERCTPHPRTAIAMNQASSPLPGSLGKQERLKVLLLENIHESAQELLAEQGFSVERVSDGAARSGARRSASRMCTSSGIRSKTQVTAARAGGGQGAVALGCFCIGTNQVDLAARQPRGVPVFNAPFSNTRSVAEMIIAEIIMLARQLGDRSREVHEGRGARSPPAPSRCAARRWASSATATSAARSACSPRRSACASSSTTSRPSCRWATTGCSSLEELLGESDFVTLHVPATPRDARDDRRDRARADEARQLPDQRQPRHGGGDPGAGRRAQERSPRRRGDRRLSRGAGGERRRLQDATLQSLPNVILTPHIGGSTGEAQAAIGREVATSLLRFAFTRRDHRRGELPADRAAARQGHAAS